MGAAKTRSVPADVGVEAAPKLASARRRTEKAAKLPVVAQASPAAAPAQVLRSIADTVIDPLSLLFDTDWYRLEYPDVAAAGLDPIRHFFDNGAREGRNPNPYFETNWYVSTNADVAASMMNPFLHYLLYGAREGRKAKP